MIAAAGPPFAFSEPRTSERAQQIIAKYPAGRQASAVLPLLHLAQRQNGGWLTMPALDYVADFLEMPPHPRLRGRHLLHDVQAEADRPPSRRGVHQRAVLAARLRRDRRRLQAQARHRASGETTADGLFTLSEAECLGACVNAPMMQIGDDYYEDLTPESMEAILDALARGETPKAGSQIGRRGAEPMGGLTSLTSMPGRRRHGSGKAGGEA